MPPACQPVSQDKGVAVVTRPVHLRGRIVHDPSEVVSLYQPGPSRMPPQEWQRHGAFVTAAVRAAAYPSPWGALGAMQTVSSFVGWCIAQDYPIRAEQIFVPDLVEQFIGSLPGRNLSALSTYRSRLRRVGIANTTRAPWRPTPRPLRSSPHVHPPYAATELAGFWAAADDQKTSRRRHVLRTMLTFGLGAGVRSGELADLTAEAVQPHQGHPRILICHLPGRSVPLRADLVDTAHDLLAAATKRAGPGALLLGHTRGDVKDPLGKATRGLELPRVLPALRMSRLRTTWAITLLTNGIRVSEYATVSGSTSGRILEELASHIPEREGDDLLTALTGGPIG